MNRSLDVCRHLVKSLRTFKALRRMLALTLILAFTTPGLAQNSSIAISGPNRLTMQNEGTNSAATVHRSPTGQPCLQIEAAARAHVVNLNLYDHVISIYNQCLGAISLRVCYYHSSHCVDMAIPGLKRRDAILGVYPNVTYFRYSYSEKSSSGFLH